MTRYKRGKTKEIQRKQAEIYNRQSSPQITIIIDDKTNIELSQPNTAIGGITPK